jgi:hypothetical protein
MTQKIEATGDVETDALLEEMAQDGEIKKEPAPAEEAKPEPKEEAEAVESKVEEGKDEEEEEEEVETTEPPKSPSVAEIKKVEYWRDKAKKLKQQLENVKLAPENIDEEIKVFAKEQGIDEKAAYKLADIVARKALSSEDREVLEQIKEERKDKEFWKLQKDHFQEEFDRSIIPLLREKSPEISDKEIRETFSKLDELAWKKENSQKSLTSLYLETSKISKKTGESNSIHSIGKTTNVENPTDEDIVNIITDGSEEEFEKLSDSLGKKSPKLNK